jgi:hypothetical protein
MDVVATQATLEAILNHTATVMLIKIKKANLAVPPVVLKRLVLAVEQEATGTTAATQAEATAPAAAAAATAEDGSDVS